MTERLGLVEPWTISHDRSFFTATLAMSIAIFAVTQRVVARGG